ncbi:MOSC domain-containing protein, partial [Rhizobium ruizarguesonis]
MRVSDLFIYPLKSARGIALPAADIDGYGLPGDRRAMITDAQGHFITQRELPDLARIEVRPEASAFRLLMQEKTDISVAAPQPENRMDVIVWKSAVSAAVADPESNRQLSEWLGREVRLVFFDGQARRTANAEWAGEGTPVTFTDGYQILVATTGSLKALNADLAAHGEGSVGMERFRPNVVIDTDEAWPEDRWAAIEIAGIRFDLVKPCSRCIMTT